MLQTHNQCFSAGQRVMIYPYYDTDIGLIGTVVGQASGGWSDEGGVYLIELDSGRYFNCSVDAMIPYESKEVPIP